MMSKKRNSHRNTCAPALGALMLLVVTALAPGVTAGPMDTYEEGRMRVQEFAGCAPGVLEDAAKTVENWYAYADETVKQVKCKLNMMPTGITIDGDDDFWLVEGTVTNEAKGVVAGSGTADDPFLIYGHEWNVQVGHDMCPALKIKDTTAHVVVQGNLFHSTSLGIASCTAIKLDNAENVVVRGNIIENMGGIFAWNSDDVTVESNTFRDTYVGVYSSGDQGLADNLKITNNEIDGARTGIRVYGANGVISKNTIWNVWETDDWLESAAIFVDGGEMKVRENRIRDGLSRITYYTPRNGATIYDNYMMDATFPAIYVRGTYADNLVVEDNRIDADGNSDAHFSHAIRLSGSDGDSFTLRGTEFWTTDDDGLKEVWCEAITYSMDPGTIYLTLEDNSPYTSMDVGGDCEVT